MRSLLPQRVHYYIYIFSLVLLVLGMPLSKFLMSLSQIILICNWVISGDLKSKFISFFNNKPAMVLGSLLLLHILGLLYTSDFHYASNDIRTKIPLLLLPLIISTSPPLPDKIVQLVLKSFVAAILIATVISTLILAGIIHREVLDIRNISIFISHIRFALLICVALFVCIYLAWQSSLPKWKILYAGIAAWLIVFLVLMESITGIASFAIAVGIWILYRIFKLKQPVLRYGIFAALLALVVYSVTIVRTVITEEAQTDVVDFEKLDTHTAQGNAYFHDAHSSFTENGHYIWIYYCEKELKEEWLKRSKIDFNWKDKKDNVLRFTLVRFLASKNLRKDAEGLRQLTDEEIRAVERGVTNVNYQHVSSLKGRLHEILWEIRMYRKTGDANGHSLTQRFEYWKTAKGIISDNLLIGVGTGDAQLAFDAQYEKDQSSLQKQWRFRSHNQYLSIAVAFGLIGLLWFLITLFYPVIKLNKTTDFLYITFFIVATVSFLTEDTLETQAGVTFFAFFNTFFLFCTKGKRSDLPV